MFEKIKRKSTCFLVLDASDLFGTLNLDIIEHCFVNKIKVTIIINK